MITDARGSALSKTGNFQRIISLVPSSTESIVELGGGKQLVGITRYCIHPKEFLRNKCVVGGTKQINWETLRSVSPDLIIANQEENTQECIETLEEMGYPCYVAFPKTIDQAMVDLQRMATLINLEERAHKWIQSISEARQNIRRSSFTYVYLIWRKPWMSINEHCFISDMLREIGGRNLFAGHSKRYFSCTAEEIINLRPDFLFLSSEPFPFKEKHRQEWIDLGADPHSIQLIDGEMCSWHGVRMAKGLEYLQQMSIKWS